jgi:hypothetical protein
MIPTQEMSFMGTQSSPPRRLRQLWLLACACAWLLTACGDSAEAARIQVPFQARGALAPRLTDLRYMVTLDTFRVAIRDLELTTAGETHTADAGAWLRTLWLPQALAHAGHYAGGAVIGELTGRFVFDWAAPTPTPLGDATLLDGQTYTGLNFSFTTASAADGLPADDLLIGHTAQVIGRAVSASGQTFTFTALINQDEGRQVVGVPFDAQIRRGQTQVASFLLLLHDPTSDKTLLDGIDFASLDPDGDGHVTLTPDTPPYNRLRRAMQTHDFYLVQY